MAKGVAGGLWVDAARGAAALKKRVRPSLSKITKQTTGLLKGAGKGAFRILKAAREDPFGLTLRGNMEVERNDPEDLAWDNNDIGPSKISDSKSSFNEPKA